MFLFLDHVDLSQICYTLDDFDGRLVSRKASNIGTEHFVGLAGAAAEGGVSVAMYVWSAGSAGTRKGIRWRPFAEWKDNYKARWPFAYCKDLCEFIWSVFDMSETNSIEVLSFWFQLRMSDLSKMTWTGLQGHSGNFTFAAADLLLPMLIMLIMLIMKKKAGWWFQCDQHWGWCQIPNQVLEPTT